MIVLIALESFVAEQMRKHALMECTSAAPGNSVRRNQAVTSHIQRIQITDARIPSKLTKYSPHHLTKSIVRRYKLITHRADKQEVNNPINGEPSHLHQEQISLTHVN